MESDDCVPGSMSSLARVTRPRFWAGAALSLVLLAGSQLSARADEAKTTSTTTTTSSGPTFSGNVSWYGGQFHGRKTASGEIFDIKKCTAAHRKLPFGTKVLVENPRTGKSVIVKVNDRGPYAKGRVLDLSRGAAEKLGILLGGVAFVDCTVLGKNGPSSSSINKAVIGFFPEEHFVALAINSDQGLCSDVEDADVNFDVDSSMISFVD